jgi:hypothetical protein
MVGLLVATAWAESDGSRTPAVHLLPLLDEQSTKIVPDAGPAPPVSMRATCGQCHDYDAIQSGWHFTTEGDDGRPGEPWVLVDEQTGTQLPVSERDWPGVWKPEALGLTPWDMTKLFGRHAPGGEVQTPDPEHDIRWAISGQVEVNCLACHSAAPEQNMSEWVIQLARENFRWAATAASGLGIVDGMASRLPDSYDIYDGPNLDNIWMKPPSVSYDLRYFDQKNRVFLDLTRRPPDSRCYFCHSTQHVTAEPAQSMPDVHHAAGLHCTDCHQNEIDHKITRGYEGETAEFSCRACHIQDGTNASAGRLGAPIAEHRGIPESHFEKLACTACHAGPWPSEHAGQVRTARANRLGVHGKARWDTDLPYIVSPVLMREGDSPIAPHHMLWPAFWGRRTGETVTPLPLDVVRPVVAQVLEAKRAAQAPPPPAEAQEEAEATEIPEGLSAEDAPPAEESAAASAEVKLDASDIVSVLKLLAETAALEGTPVYVSGGAVHELEASGALRTVDHPAAKPYVWPFGHDVRPAAQALGARGCVDCHSEGSAFFYGEVSPASPLATATAASFPMYQLQKLEPSQLEAWTEAEQGHRVFVISMWVVAGLLALILARYGLSGLERIARAFVATRKRS